MGDLVIVDGEPDPQRGGQDLDVGGVERILFALVTGQALAPPSKLEATRWIREEVHIDRLAEVNHTSCYRAMDWLLEHLKARQPVLFDSCCSSWACVK